jgi:acyl-CoA synthetase (AMP-forming)/AMP-acid ligase II
VTGSKYTFSQLEDLSRRIGSYLYRKGVRKGDVVCYYGTNNPEFLLLMMGCASTGVILTTANPAYTSGNGHSVLK